MLMASDNPKKKIDRLNWPIIRIIFLAPPEWKDKFEMLAIKHNTDKTDLARSLIDKAICEGKL